jgi:hypothetical protein
MGCAERTDEKLRFAAAILRDLRSRPGATGDDFQRAREEAFLFHLHGARDAFLHEVNDHHDCGLAIERVTLGALRKILTPTGKGLTTVDEIHRLEKTAGHMLHRLKEWRHTATHRGSIPRTFFVEGSEYRQRQMTDPVTGKPSGQDTPDCFSSMLNDMARLLEQLRCNLAAVPR